jgi:hypothetical protein
LLNRDHTTVLHGCRQVATELALAAHDGPTAATLRAIRELLATAALEAATNGHAAAS